MYAMWTLTILLAGFGAATRTHRDGKLTKVSIPDLQCGGCALKVTDKLAQVPGVAAVEADMITKTITVTPKPGAVISLVEVWEAVEMADLVPAKLTGPGGTFTAKPRT